MPGSKYIKAIINGQSLDLFDNSEVPISINYKLEDPENFQSKKSSEAFNVDVPATVNNDQVANTLHNPSVEDLTTDEFYRSFANAVIEANGYELLVGKALLISARHGSCPISYTYDFYGNNGDWIIPLQEVTLYDLLKDISFELTKQNIVDSWAFDGSDPNLPYVFAPVRYGTQLETSDAGTLDYNMLPIYMRPSLSVYWILYRGFQKIGYKMVSDLFDTPFFRRQVMPWTWGNFLYSDGTRLDNLDFLAKSSQQFSLLNQSYTGYADVYVSNDSTNGAFDNNNVYSYNSGTAEMKWSYLNAFNYGALDATFHANIFIDAIATANSDVEVYLHWFKNGVQFDQDTVVYLNSPTIGRREFTGILDFYKTVRVNPGDNITCKVYIDNFDSGLGRARINKFSIEAFELDSLRIPLGGLIDFSGYNALKNYKFLDFVAGVLDCYNISPQADPINKRIYLEPLHPYSLSNDLSIQAGGYFNGTFDDWNDKQDVSKTSEISLPYDGDRELLFRFKNDSNDGLLKKIQDRNSTTLGQGKFVFSDRFKAGKKEMENRFFSAAVHVEMLQWKGLGSDADMSPQIVCLVPENISNTSRQEAQNTFLPKICFYKGIINEVGWVFDGEELSSYPFMFSVNYQPGGEADPVLSYSDERIGLDGSYSRGKGLLRRFFLQRMAIAGRGHVYNTNFKLKNIDVSDFIQRTLKSVRGHRWELVEINNYLPLKEESTNVLLRKWVPVTASDSNSVFPSPDSVLNNNNSANDFDLKYNPMLGLSSDIPAFEI